MAKQGRKARIWERGEHEEEKEPSVNVVEKTGSVSIKRIHQKKFGQGRESFRIKKPGTKLRLNLGGKLWHRI